MPTHSQAPLDRRFLACLFLHRSRLHRLPIYGAYTTLGLILLAISAGRGMNTCSALCLTLGGYSRFSIPLITCYQPLFKVPANETGRIELQVAMRI